ncbi:hypothetical protein [Amycolatopsis sp. NPDC059657]|uniref:hypothetical protein n=1 Tax=Amycolatopsis sp. NPDC059657 TaxID=3346899 RepID=UPI00366BD95A
MDSIAIDGGLHANFEIRVADGTDAKQLALTQARVLREVTAWLTARKQSEIGQDRAA